MQYEDSTGCLWTEEQDADGYVYYVNANTMVSEHLAANSKSAPFKSGSNVACALHIPSQIWAVRRCAEETTYVPQSYGNFAVSSFSSRLLQPENAQMHGRSFIHSVPHPCTRRVLSTWGSSTGDCVGVTTFHQRGRIISAGATAGPIVELDGSV